MRHNVGAWVAVPVHMTHAQALLVQQAANEARGAPYSLVRYLTSGYGARWLAHLLPKGGATPGHCATIAARLLKAGRGERLRHSEGYYGPSALVAELNSRVARGGSVQPVVGVPVESTLVPPDSELARAYRVAVGDNLLLHGSDEDVGAMSTTHKRAVLDMLADRVAESATRTELMMNETILARALLRSIL